MSEKTNDRGIAHDGSRAAVTPPSSTAAAASSEPTAPPTHPSLISRLSGLLHRFAEFMERHPVATLELGQLLAEVHSAGLKPDELEQLKRVVTDTVVPPTEG